MHVSDASTDPKEVELTDTAKKNKQPLDLTVRAEITFCTHVGWDGVLMLLFALVIAALLLYVTFLYTKGFQAWHRHHVEHKSQNPQKI